MTAFLRRAAAALYDSTLCSPAAVASQRRVRGLRRLPGRVEAAIPHFERGHAIHRPLRNILRDERIDGILIVDDGSSAESLRALERTLAALDAGGRVRLVRRGDNRGALQTKIECVERAEADWVILLDSDNTLFRACLDAMLGLAAPDPDTIYCPSEAFPHYRFDVLAGRALDFDACCRLTREGTLRRVYVINDGNYLLHRKAYLEAVEPLRGLRRDVADVMVTNYLWLSRGGRLWIMPHSPYYHRIDASSFWHRTGQASRQRVLKLFERFERGARWDDALLHDLHETY